MERPHDESHSAVRSELLPLGILVVLVLLFFGVLELLRPYYFLWDDNANVNLPGYVHNWRSLVEGGALAHLNLHQYLGQIWLGNGQSGVLYPPTYLAAWLSQLLLRDLRATIDLLAIFHLTLGAAGMYWLLRHHSVSRTVALLGALLWATFPFPAQVARNWIFVAFVAGLAPWNLWALARLADSPKTQSMLVLAVIKALLFYQGYANYAVMIAFFDGVYLLASFATSSQRRERWLTISLRYGGALLLTGALAAPLLLPMLEAKGLSAHRASALLFEEFISNPLGLAVAAKAQLFVMEPGAIHQSFGSLFYFGITNVVLLLFAFVPRLRTNRPPHLLALPAAITAITALVLSTRAAAVLYPLPLVSSFRWPFKHFLIFLLFATVAVAVVCELAARNRRPALRRALLALLACGILANGLVLFAKSWDQPFGPYRIDRPLGALRQEIRTSLGDPDRGRVLSLWLTHAQARPEHLTHAYASFVGAYHLGGYDPLIAAQNLELALRLDYSNIFRYALDERLLGYLSRWGVRYLIAPPDQESAARLAAWPQLSERHRDSVRQVWINRDALPIVSFREQPQEMLPFRWLVNGVEVSTSGRSGRLRIALAPLPWWYYSIDGSAFNPVSFDTFKQMEIDVPAGAETVLVEYRNVPFRLGCGLAIITSLAFLGLTFRKRNRPLWLAGKC